MADKPAVVTNETYSSSVAALDASLAPDQEQKPYGLLEVGRTGLQINAGTVNAELLRELVGEKGRKVYKQMSENDGVIGAFLFALNQMISKLEWHFEAPKEADETELAATAFLDECFDDMSQPWDQVLEEILSFAVYGWSYFEIVWKIRRGSEQTDGAYRSRFNDNRIGWRKFAIRGQNTLLQWMHDDHDNVTGMEQTTSRGSVRIPLKKALLFRITQTQNNPEGRSLLRTAYRPWFFKTRIEEYEAIGIERELAGYPVVTTPPGWHMEGATLHERAALNSAKDLAQSLRRGESEGVVIPALFDERGNKLFSVDLITSGGGRQIDLGEAVQRKNQEIAMSVLADFLMLGHEENGSRSLGVIKIDLWTLSVTAIAKSIAEVFNQYATPMLLRLNGFKPSRIPKLSFGEVNRVDLDALGPFLKVLLDGGIITADQDIEAWARELIKAPPPQAPVI